MQEAKVSGTYVAEKISKIRWVPEAYVEPSSFVTGSWGFDVNSVEIWKIAINDTEDDNDSTPQSHAKLRFTGDISGLEFVDADNICVASTDGFISLVNINRNADHNNLKETYRFKDIHSLHPNVPAPCTGLSTFDGEIVSVGEDGRLNLLQAKTTRILRKYDNADSISLTTVLFVNHNEILTGNRMGVVKIFDSRSSGEKPQANLLVSCQEEKRSNSVNCLTCHPTQKHVILSGSEEGSITVWDLRKPNYPASYFAAHDLGITELAFHKTQPTKVYSASQNGELWQWNQNCSPSTIVGVETEPWLNGERAKNKFNVTSLIEGINKPIQTFDTWDTKVVVGCDSESIYIIENVY